MKIHTNLATWKHERTRMNDSLGFVPTMGALHAGHLALIDQARDENDETLVSIFVNPTQFNDPRDLEAYPRTLEEDFALLEKSGVTHVLVPEVQEMYPEKTSYAVVENTLSLELEGAHRPGHFSGMLTIVLKLLLLVRADRAYFGEKDFQQLRLVQGLVEAFFLSTQIVPVPTFREDSGLALSSRNRRLTRDQQEKAAFLNLALRESFSAEAAQKALQEKGFQVDYVSDRWGRRLAAVHLEGVRLIDNISLLSCSQTQENSL